jgi:RNA polymerase sigma-70 factor (ECF subfamily)
MMYPDHKPKEVHVPSDTRRDSFLKAVEARKHSMYRVALMMLRHPADAEDAVSDAVEITWRRLHSIRDLEALPAYLMRSTINACHAVLRKRRRETAMDALEQYLPPVQEETPVWMYLGNLKERYRLPLLLRFSENMSDRQIAQILKVPRGTVSSILSRGLKMLREQIEKEEKGCG